MLADLAVTSELQMPKGQTVCDPNTFLNEIHSESHHSN